MLTRGAFIRNVRFESGRWPEVSAAARHEKGQTHNKCEEPVVCKLAEGASLRERDRDKRTPERTYKTNARERASIDRLTTNAR